MIKYVYMTNKHDTRMYDTYIYIDTHYDKIMYVYVHFHKHNIYSYTVLVYHILFYIRT